MSTLELTFLGSGNAFAPGRYWSSFLVNDRYLFDAPPTVLPNMKKLGKDLAAVEIVLVTHFHGDHFLGLPFLFLEYAYLTARQQDLTVVGPPGVQNMVEGVAEMAYPGMTQREAGYRRLYIEAQPGDEKTVGDLTIRALPMNHAQGKLTCLGYRVAVGDKVIAYTGDTMFCQGIFDLAENADVLVIDCSYSQEPGPEHLGFTDIVQIRHELDPKTAIILTHLPAEAPDVTGLKGIWIAQDLATWRLGGKTQKPSP